MPEWWRRLWLAASSVVAGAILVAATLWLLRYLLPVSLPFLIGAVLALFLEPLVRPLERRLPRGVAVFLAILFFLLFLGLVFTLLGVYLAVELGDLAGSIPAYALEAQDKLFRWFNWLRERYGTLPPEAARYLEMALNTLAASAQKWAASLATSLISFFGAIPGFFLIVFVSFLATYFIGRDRYLLESWWQRLWPQPWGETSLNLLRRTSTAFWGYLKAQFFLVSLTALVTTVGLWLSGVKYALTLGLLTGLLDLLPVLGPSTLFLPWIAYSFFSGSVPLGIKLSLVYGSTFVLRQLLEARVVAFTLGAHPLAVLFGMYAGLKLIGPGGLVLGPVAVIVIQALYRAWQASRD
ncbi:sporulation integral membrane protein YtvI [Ammonifex thiophilus]|uniref:sporulation integral membrane protein YtvI n=1 Tax=Ammonifex thiophilus TaxID=444093 RepID=UPI0014021311|nr:sporulation integral membrane protein YtvI [Ammonifex thiophilus]